MNSEAICLYADKGRQRMVLKVTDVVSFYFTLKHRHIEIVSYSTQIYETPFMEYPVLPACIE